MVNAGDNVRAVHLSPLMDALQLEDGLRPASTAGFEDWGNPLVFPNPGVPVKVKAYGVGQATNDSDAAGIGMRVGISLDGGNTYSYGTGPRDQAAGGASTRRASVSCLHLVDSGDAAPTGDVYVQAQFESTVITVGNPTFFFGSILGEVHAK